MAKVGAVPVKSAPPAAAAGAEEVAKWEERAQIAEARARESEAVLKRVEADIKRVAAEAKLRELIKAQAQR